MKYTMAGLLDHYINLNINVIEDNLTLEEYSLYCGFILGSDF